MSRANTTAAKKLPPNTEPAKTEPVKPAPATSADKPSIAAHQGERPSARAMDAVKQVLAEAKPVEALLNQEIWARESGIKFNTWEVVPKAGTPIENLLRKEYWCNVAQRMKGGDTVIVYPRDGAYYAELIVWDAGQNWANVTAKGYMPRPEFEAVAGVASDFEIASDPIDGIVVKRKSTGAKVKGNFPNHADAQRWIMDHQRALRS